MIAMLRSLRQCHIERDVEVDSDQPRYGIRKIKLTPVLSSGSTSGTSWHSEASNRAKNDVTWSPRGLFWTIAE